MFKWLLILLVILVGVWLFSRQSIPAEYLYSKTGKKISLILYPLEKRVDNWLARYSGMRKDVLIVDNTRFISILEGVQKSEKPAIIFFYKSDCFMCRLTINSLNNNAAIYGDRIHYLFVAFQSDENALGLVLNSIDKLNFKPIITDEKTMELMKYQFPDLDITFDKPPMLILKTTDKEHEIVPVEPITPELLNEKLKL